MKVREIMSREVRTVTPQTTLGEAALLMRQADIGALLVNEGERLTGVVTDRDLAVRGLADGLGADRPVREVMSGELRYCFEDEEVDHVAKNMAQLEKRRLPVMDRNKRQVAVAVGERTRVDLVDHRAFPPGRLEGLQHGASTGEPALLLGTLG